CRRWPRAPRLPEQGLLARQPLALLRWHLPRLSVGTRRPVLQRPFSSESPRTSTTRPARAVGPRGDLRRCALGVWRLMLNLTLRPAKRRVIIYSMRAITRSYRIRAYPNGAQRRLLDRWFGAARWLWNTTLEIRSAAYNECSLTLTGNDVSRWLTQW